MITAWLLGLLLGTLSGMLGLIPGGVLDMSGMVANVSMISSLAGTLNGYFPLVTLGICLGVVLGLKLLMMGWRLVLFVYHQFWGSS